MLISMEGLDQRCVPVYAPNLGLDTVSLAVQMPVKILIGRIFCRVLLTETQSSPQTAWEEASLIYWTEQQAETPSAPLGCSGIRRRAADKLLNGPDQLEGGRLRLVLVHHNGRSVLDSG